MEAKGLKNNRIGCWLIVAFFVLCWLFFFFVYPYHLYYKEEITLFVQQPDCLKAYFLKPAFFCELLGDYLTQYFLWRGGGSTIIVFFLIFSWWGLRNSFRTMGMKSFQSAIWALVPVAIECALSCHLEYPLSMNICFALSVWTFVLCTRISNVVVRRVLHLFILLLLYLLGGAHFLIYALLVIAFELKQKRSIIFSISMLLAAFLIPFFVGYLFYLTPTQSYYYPLISRYMLAHPFIYLLTEAGLLFTLLPIWLQCLSKDFVAAGCLVVTIVISLFLCYNQKEERTLAFSCEAYFGHWDKVIRMSQKDSSPSYLSVYYTNLAYAKKGRLCDELMNHYQPGPYGLLMNIKETMGYIYAMASPDALIACGDMAQAQHSAMLAMMFTPHQRSSRMMRRLADIAMVNGEYSVARKYLLMLSHTSLHKTWANRQLDILNDSTVNVQLSERRQSLARQDTLFSANQWQLSLINLLKANPTNKMAADYLLCLHLLNKDLKSFKEDYDVYYYPIFGSNPPRLYQEALMECMSPNKTPEAQLRHYRISTKVFRDCLNYLAAYQKVQGDGKLLRAQFGKTYWFYHYYAQLKS